MKLPNLENLVVPRAKVVDYLLSPTHRDGRHKAQFFAHFGFTQNNWQQLAELLRRHALEHEITKVEPSAFGTRYVLEGIMNMPDGRAVPLRAVWFVSDQQEDPRFVTAYPLS
jgi:Domain of unknown function (DUF6883)